VADPEYIGQGVWCAIMPRTLRFQNRVDHVMGRSPLSLVFNPVSDYSYVYVITEGRPQRNIVKKTWPANFRQELDGTFP